MLGILEGQSTVREPMKGKLDLRDPFRSCLGSPWGSWPSIQVAAFVGLLGSDLSLERFDGLSILLERSRKGQGCLG